MYKYFWNFLSAFKSSYILLFILLIITNILSLISPLALKYIIDDIIPQRRFTLFFLLLGTLVLLYLIRIICSLYSNITFTKVSRQVITNIRNDLYYNILQNDINYFRKNNVSDIIFKLTSDVDIVQNIFSSIFLKLLNNIFTVIFILITLLSFNVKLTIASLITIPLVIINTNYWKKSIKHSFVNLIQKNEAIYNYFLETLKNVRIVKSFGTVDYEVYKSKEKHSEWINNSVMETYYKSLSASISTFLTAITPIIILLYGGLLVFDNLLTVGTLIAFIQYSNKLFTPILTIANNYNDFIQAKVSMYRLYGYVKNKNNCFEPDRLINQVEKIHLQDVNLRFEDRTILNKFTTSFKKGKIYGIMGQSGIGKSTIAMLIQRFIIPNEGNILINNSIELDNIKGWENHVILVEKENQLFTNSVKNNIIYGCTGKFDIASYRKAVALSQLRDIIDRLEYRDDTIISSQGDLLSDGEKQRISIARMMYKKFVKGTSVIIFDESTACLDVKMEQDIISNIKENFTDGIIIIISHRDSLKHICDKLITLNRNENSTELLVSA